MPQNFKTATKKSIHESKVAQLDSFGKPLDEFLQEGSLTIIENIAGDFVDRVHANINKEKGMVTTGRINDITIQAENGTVNIKGHNYLLYQDRGVSGTKKKYDTPHFYSTKMPPQKVFVQYIKDKNIRLIDNHKYKGDSSPFEHLTEDEKINKAAWGMAVNVYKNGFKPRRIFSKEIPQLIKELKEQVAGFCVQAIKQDIAVKPSAQRTIIK